MDIHCPRCGEPWDHDELHGEWTEGRPEAILRFTKRIRPRLRERVREELQREYGDLDAVPLHVFHARLRYYENAEAFRRYGCPAFGGARCNPASKASAAAQAAMAASDYPEEWASD